MTVEQIPLPSAPTPPHPPVSWPAPPARPDPRRDAIAATAQAEREPAPTSWPRIFPGL